MATSAVVLVSPPAGSQTASGSVADADAKVTQLRQQADALSADYFQALGRLADVQRKIDDIEARLPGLDAENERLRLLTQARAVTAYKRSGSTLGAVIEARSAMHAARRVELLDRLNRRDTDVSNQLRATSARLADERSQLRSARDSAASALDDVRTQGAQIDALLASAQTERQAAGAATTPTSTGATSSAAGPVTATTSTTAPATPAATTPTTAPPPKPTTPTAPPNYTPTPGVSSHHDEPFLVCTRARESGGNYAAVNPAGPYLGAYQFLQSTWNSAANHAGRPDLVGVPPNAASQYDQDEVAWALYQWQGSRPWGGYCD